MSKYTNRFVISDLHLGHTNSWAKFKNPDGTPLRPFSSTEEMDETIIERWNAKVSHSDHVYVLGDVVINKKSLHLVKRLNGHKRLIRGNHDIFKDDEYREVGFEQIHGVRVFVDKWIFSHIPLHPNCVTDRFRVNVHGHLHGNRVTRKVSVKQGVLDFTPDIDEIDPRYYCVCVEQTNYTPLAFEELEEKIQQQFDEYDYTPPVGYFNGSSAS